MLNKLERALGKYAIPNLMRYLIGGYVLGYFLMLGSRITNVNFLSYMTLEPYYIIHKFQIWRIFTWIMIPEICYFLLLCSCCIISWELRWKMHGGHFVIMPTFLAECLQH